MREAPRRQVAKVAMRPLRRRHGEGSGAPAVSHGVPVAVHHDAADATATAIEVERHALVAGQRPVEVADDLLLAVIELHVDLLEERAAARGADLERLEPTGLGTDGDELAPITGERQP